MSKFPDPPPAATLASLSPEVHELPAGARLWRIYFQGGAHPTTWETFRAWGPTGSRFDPQEPPPSVQPHRCVVYTAGDVNTCLAEVYQAYRKVHRSRDAPALVAFATTRPLRLLDLTGLWPTRAGASGAIATGPHVRAQRWARAIYAAYPGLDGLIYRSSMNGRGVCHALWAPAKDAIPRSPLFHRRLEDPVLYDALRVACANIGYVLL
jgi:hypothetical protein